MMHGQKNIKPCTCISCRFCIPMPQLTPEFDRVIIHAIPSADATLVEVIDYIKLLLMVQEIRISEDYSHSDIIIADMANYTLAHVPKVNLTHLKKYELCVLVSVLVIRNVSLYVTISHYMSLCVTICHYMSLNVTMSLCHYMSLHVTICHYMSLYVTICHYMSLYVTICHCMSRCVTICHYTSLYVTMCHVPLYVTVCHYVSLYVTICHCMSLCLTMCHYMSLYVTQ